MEKQTIKNKLRKIIRFFQKSPINLGVVHELNEKGITALF